MVKRRRESESDVATPTAAEQHPVFVDTSIDTRLVMLVSKSETVSDFKKKIAREHMQCFPKFGELEVHSLKVQRRGNFYHLADVMHVWSAFQGAKGSWFLSTDVSGSALCCAQEKSSELGTNGDLVIVQKNVDEHHKDLTALTMSLEDCVTKKDNVNDVLHIGRNENFTAIESPVKKKRKLKHTEDLVYSIALKDSCPLLHVCDKDMSKVESPMVVAVNDVPEVMLPEKQEKSPLLEATAENSSMRDDQNYTEDGVLKGTSQTAKAVLKDSDTIMKLPNISASDTKGDLMVENEPEKYVATEILVGGNVEVSSGTFMEVSGEGDVDSHVDKRKRKKTQKSAPNTLDTSVWKELTVNGESNKQATETYTAEETKGITTHETAEEKEDKTKLSQSSDQEHMSSQVKSSDIDPGNMLKQTSYSQPMPVSNVVEPEYSNQKKKKRVKMHMETNSESLSMEHANNVVTESVVMEKLTTVQLDHGPEQNVASKLSQGGENEDQNICENLKDASGGNGEVTSIGDRKKKKKKSRRKADEDQDVPVVEKQAMEAVIDREGTETLTSEEKKGQDAFSFFLTKQDGFSQSHEFEVLKSSQLKSSNSTIVESSVVVEPESIDHQKKKKREKKYVGKSLENSLMEQADSVVSESLVIEQPVSRKLDHEPKRNLLSNLSQGGGTGDITYDGDRRKKKKKSRRTAPDVQDVSVVEEQATKAASSGVGTESLTSEEKKGHSDFPQSHGYELVKSSQLKSSDSMCPEVMPKEASCFQQIQETNIVAEQDISITSQKKRKSRKKPVVTNVENSDVEKFDTSVSASSDLRNAKTDHIPAETDKEGSVVQNDERNEVLTGKKDSSTEKSSNKMEDATDLIEVVLIQPEKYLEGVAAEKQRMEEKTNSTPDKANQIVGFGQEEKKSENTENKDKKGKRKKTKVSSSDVDESIYNNNLKVNDVALSTVEKSSAHLDSEQEKINVASSQALHTKSEEELVGMQGTAVNTDGSKEPVENIDEGINFKQYFVPNTAKGEKTTKPNEEMTPMKKAKKHLLPSVSVSSELPNSHKGSNHGKAAQNSDRDEVVPGSILRSSTTSGNGVKSQGPKKPRRNLDVSSQPKEKKKPFDVSSTERSQTLPEKKGSSNKLQIGQSLTNKSVTKMSTKKSLLSKSGAIFQDTSGDSCDDGNGTVHSDARIGGESDSSSVSDSESSLDSTRNGSSHGRGTGATKLSNLELSNDSKKITMDMILKSSKRFKKTWMLVSKNQDDEIGSQIEVVPESEIQ